MPFFKHFSRILLRKKRVYLDYASATPRDSGMLRGLSRLPNAVAAANPSALHTEGVALSRALADARTLAARTLDVHSDEIIFTSSATESDNLAIVGTLYGWLAGGILPSEIVIFSSDLEHAAVAETIEQFTARGVQHNIFPIGDGVVDPKHIIIPENAKAVLVSVMYVSNEIGTVQPIAEIAKRIRKLRKAHPDVVFIFHTDATQAPAHLSLRVPSLGVDLMTLGATKLYCNKGVGMLYKKRALTLLPIMKGGGQEWGLRPGTQPVALVREFTYALSYAQQKREEESARIMQLRDLFESEIAAYFPEFRVTGQSHQRSPHITHIGVPEFDSELLVIELDARGIAVSAKSACKNEADSESAVVEKLYGAGWGAVRFSFGRQTRQSDIYRAIRALRAVCQKYRQ